MINAYLNTDTNITVNTSSPNKLETEIQKEDNLNIDMNNVIAIPTSAKSYIKNFKDTDWIKDLVYYTITIPCKEHKLKQPHITAFLINENDSLQNAVLFYKVLTNDDVILYADMQVNGVCKIEEI